MEIAFSCSVGVPGIDESGYDGEAIGRSGQEEGLYSAVIESLDHGREEVCY
jgi:hypothetical protein